MGKHTFNDEEIKILKEQFDAGWTIFHVQRALKIGVPRLHRFIKEYNIKYAPKLSVRRQRLETHVPDNLFAGRRKFFTKEETASIIEKIKAGNSLNTIYSNLKVSKSRIVNVLKENKIEYAPINIKKNCLLSDTIENTFKENSTVETSAVKTLIKRYNILEHNKCWCCGITNWLDKPIVFQLHHINGYNTDHRLENLQFLCLNCHSQTENFGSRNKQKIKDVSEEELINAVKAYPNNNKLALRSVGLPSRRNLYQKIYRIKSKYHLWNDEELKNLQALIV